MGVHDFFQQLAQPLTGEELFDYLADTVYFVKDAQGAYVVVNRTLVERCGVASKAALLGKTSVQVMGEPLGQQFTAQDEQVLASGNAMISQLELHLHRTGRVGWCLTTKLPLHNRHGAVVGLVGASQDLRVPNLETRAYEQVATAIRQSENRLAEPPTITEMASLANMSVYQLDRRMKHVFGLSTGQWLLKCRIDFAQKLLTSSDQTIASIAQQVGYSDQSAFSRQFRAATGLTPRLFRHASRTAQGDS